MSHTKQFDCREGINLEALAEEIEKFVNDEDVIKDPDLAISILLPAEYSQPDIKISFDAKTTKSGILEVLGTVFAAPQVAPLVVAEKLTAEPATEESVPQEPTVEGDESAAPSPKKKGKKAAE